MWRDQEAREKWQQGLDFVFFLVSVLIVGGLSVAFVALVKTTSAQLLIVLATVGPLLVLALALVAALRLVERSHPGLEATPPPAEHQSQERPQQRRAA